jgi:hypothetical protein
MDLRLAGEILGEETMFEEPRGEKKMSSMLNH